MAGAKVSLHIDGGTQVLDALQRLREMGQRMQPVFADIGEYLLQSHEERWDKQVSPAGQPWEPLSEKYLARKRKRGKGQKILVLDQHLKNLVSHATEESVEVGTPWIYGATHQFGDPRRGIPARPFLGITEEDRVEVLEILRGWIDDQITPNS